MKIVKFSFFALLFFVCQRAAATNVTQSDVTYTTFLEKQNCFNSSDGVIKYIDEGNANSKVIVLLHGVPTSGWMYRKVIPVLVADGFRVVVPDMLGFGSSQSPNGTDIYSPKQHAKRLLELMQLLQIESWTQVVHDAGSIWVDEVLNTAPKKIDNLVVLNSYLNPLGVNWKDQIGTGLTARIGLKLQSWGLKRNSFVSRFVADNLALTKLNYGEMRGYENPISAGKTEAIFQHYSYMLKSLKNNKTYLSNFSKPAIVIWGTKDDVLKLNPQRTFIKEALNITDAEIHEFQVGHLVPEEAPNEMGELIANFINPK